MLPEMRPVITPIQGTLTGLVPYAIWSCAVLAMNQLATRFNALWAAGLELGLAGCILVGIAWMRGGAISARPPLASMSHQLWNVLARQPDTELARPRSSSQQRRALGYGAPKLPVALSHPRSRDSNPYQKSDVVARAWPLLGLTLGKVATAPEGATHEAMLHVNPLAYSLAILDAIAWALYSNFSRKLSHPLGASAVPLYMLVTIAILLTASTLSETPLFPSLSDWALLMTWSVATALAYLFWDIGMRFGNVITVSTISMLIPLFSTVITAALSGHGISSTLITAAALVVAGSFLCRGE